MLRQLVLSTLLIAVTVVLWAAFVPAARPILDRIGVLGLLGIAPTSVEQGGSGGARGPSAVVVAEVGEAKVADRVMAIGDGRALRRVTVRSRVTGQVTGIGVEDGGRVEAGRLLVQLDDEAEKIALERAGLVLQDARDEAARVTRLEGTGAVTEVRRREADLALRSAELDLRQAQYDLDQRSVRAPFAGWTSVLDIAVGDRVSSQDALVTIADRSKILIDFHVPERVVGRIVPGMALKARPLALSELALDGEVQAVDNIVESTSRTLRVQGRLDNAEDRLRGGMAFEVELLFPGDTLPSVDPLAVQWSGEGAFVWAVRDGKAVRVPVTIRQRNADSVLVEAALAPGENVVVEGVQMLRDGAAVRLAEPQAVLIPASAPEPI